MLPFYTHDKCMSWIGAERQNKAEIKNISEAD